MILIGGQRPRIARASFNPSIDPGIWISVKTTVTSRTRFQNFDGLVGIRRFDNVESGSCDHVGRVHSQQKLVLDDQHHGSVGCCKTHTSHSLNGH